MATSPYLLGKLQYTYSPAQRLATGEGAYGQMEDYRQKYAQRGNYRMAIEEGAALPYGPLEKLNADGSWSPVNDPNIDYDPRQTPDVLDSNERRRFVQGFMEAPDSYDIAKKSLQTVATNNGWKEPPRKEGTTLLSLVSDIAPYVGLLTGGVGALNGLSGLLGAETIGQNTARLMSGLGDVTADIAAGTGELGSNTANLMSGLGDVTADLYNPGDVMDAALNTSQSYHPGDVMDAALRVSEPAYNPGTLTGTGGTGTAAGGASTVGGGTRSIIDTITANPGTALQVAGAAAGLLGAATQTQEDTPYNPAPINQSIVNQFGRVPTGQNINYQDFYSLGLPQGLLDSRIRRLGGLIG